MRASNTRARARATTTVCCRIASSDRNSRVSNSNSGSPRLTSWPAVTKTLATTPLGGVVARVLVTAGQDVRRGEPLFELDTREFRSELAIRQQTVVVARARARVFEARIADLQRQLDFAEQVKDKRAISAEE